MGIKLLVFDSHPVQYRVPIWKAMEQISPGSVHVVYASDCSVRGHADKGFGLTFAWDEPMLAGYENTILNCENGVPLSGWGSITGKGVSDAIEKIKPSAILLTGLNYRFDLVAYLRGRAGGIPVWLRCETQDDAVSRSKSKSVIRSLIYKAAYVGFSRIFFIGELNKIHYLKNGVSPSALKPARYGTIDRFSEMSEADKLKLRNEARLKAGISINGFTVGFSGKLINKKNPEILFNMLKYLPAKLLNNTYLYFLGSGALEDDLKKLANDVLKQYNVKCFFAGFVNQSQLAAHYLAMDVMVLPSRKMGETWGLVVNEAMQAGCSVAVSDAVGCGADFKNWERFRVFEVGNEKDLADNINNLSKFPTDFNWAKQNLKSYSIQATAEAFINELNSIGR